MTEDIRNQLDKVIKLHREIYINSRTERAPQNCAYNAEATVGMNGFCVKTHVCSLQNAPIQVLCDDLNTAIKCPSFTKYKTTGDLNAEYEAILSDPDQLSIHYPEIRALKWVLSKMDQEPQEQHHRFSWKRLLGLIP